MGKENQIDEIVETIKVSNDENNQLDDDEITNKEIDQNMESPKEQQPEIKEDGDLEQMESSKQETENSDGATTKNENEISSEPVLVQNSETENNEEAEIEKNAQTVESETKSKEENVNNEDIKDENEEYMELTVKDN